MEDLFFQKNEEEQAPWSKRYHEVVSIREYLADHYGDANATQRLAKFVNDEEWKIREQVACAMSSIAEDALPVFMPLLSDTTSYVASNARYAMDRRSAYQKTKAKQEKHESELFVNLEKLSKKFGPEAAKLALEDIENAYELTVGYAAHDIRGILTPICDQLEIMNQLALADLPSSKLIRFAKAKQFIDMRVDMLYRMINDMQDLARSTPGKRMQENLRDLLLSAVEDIKANFNGKLRDISKVSFDTDDIPVDLTIPVDRQAISRAFINLIKNAVESYMSTPNIAQEGDVRISASEVSSGVEVCIVDHGMGLTEQELKRLRLFLPRSTSKKKTGTGLGMAIAYARIKDHGGTLSLESEGANKGVTAIVFLPYREN